MEQRRILIVDDDENIRELLELYLTSAGFDAVCCGNAHGALRELDSGSFDLVLLDVKHAVEEKHRIITGVGNSKIKLFANYLSDSSIPIWIRYVLLPGYTDDEEDLKLAAEFIGTLKTVEKIEVLPYHSMGSYKWDKMGQEYRLKDVKEASAAQVKKAQQILSGK